MIHLMPSLSTRPIRLLALLAFLLCAGSLTPPVAHAAPKKWRVALVLPGLINDRGFNANGYAGLMLAKERYGVETAFSENTPMANYARVGGDHDLPGHV